MTAQRNDLLSLDITERALSQFVLLAQHPAYVKGLGCWELPGEICVMDMIQVICEVVCM